MRSTDLSDVPSREGARSLVILKAFIAFSSLIAALVAAQTVCAQALTSDDVSVGGNTTGAVYTAMNAGTPIVSVAPGSPAAGGALYVRPNAQRRFNDYAWNAVGPVAFAGAAFAGAIDQGFDFERGWGQGWNAYGVRVASNLGISMVTATAQYSIAEAMHEDTAYYRCTCGGFGRRFVHAAISSVTSRRGEDGHRSISLALTASPLIGPMVAANTWLPTHDGLHLGLNMGEHNLLGQFAQDEALEFAYGGPNTLLGKIKRSFKRLSRSAAE